MRALWLGLAAAMTFGLPSVARAEDAANDVDTAGLAAGIALVSTGGLGALGGGITYLAASLAVAPDGTDPYRTEKMAGIVALLLGGAAIGGGVPLIVAATRKSRRATKPEVRVGIGGATVCWTF